MFIGDIATGNAISSTVIIILLLIGSVGTICVMPRLKIYSCGVSGKLSILLIYIAIVALLYSLFFPLDARNTYILLFLPLILYYYTIKVSNYSNYKYVLLSVCIVYLLLIQYFLSNYYNNIWYETENQNNASYCILYLLPFLLCYKNKLLSALFIILTLIIVAFSLKRGGLIALLLAAVVYVIVLLISHKDGKKTAKMKALVFLALLLIIFGVYYLYESIDELLISETLFARFEELEENGGSGRIDIYAQFFKLLNNNSIFEWVIGHGWRGSVRMAGIACHNDLLEVLFDFGIIGLILYVSLWCCLINLFCRLYRSKHFLAPAMGASLVIFFINSMVSSIITIPWYMLEFSMFWGFVVAIFNNQRVYYISNK